MLPLVATIALSVLSGLPKLIDAADSLFRPTTKRKTGKKKKQYVMNQVKEHLNEYAINRADKKEIVDTVSKVTDAIVGISKTVNTVAR